MVTIEIDRRMEGTILDIGGGGEGIIGQAYGARVTAIDNRQEELDEAPGGFCKLLMDARQLAFAEAVFDHVTAFYSLMYMEEATQRQAILEAARVLRPGGRLHIWDADIREAAPKPFLAELVAVVNGKPIPVTYGVVKEETGQNALLFRRYGEEAGLSLLEHSQAQGHFYLCFGNDKNMGRD